MTQPIADRRAERALLAAVMVSADLKTLAKLDEKDFHYSDCLLLFKEIRLMAEQGEPLGDEVAVGRWFSSDAAKARAAEVQIKNLPALAGELFMQAIYARQLGYYLKVVRRDRVRRSVAWVCMKIAEVNEQEQNDPGKTLAQLQSAVDQLWERYHEVFPDEV